MFKLNLQNILANVSTILTFKIQISVLLKKWFRIKWSERRTNNTFRQPPKLFTENFRITQRKSENFQWKFKHCESNNGSLVEIWDSEKQKDVFEYLEDFEKKNPGYQDDYWIGMNVNFVSFPNFQSITNIETKIHFLDKMKT